MKGKDNRKSRMAFIVTAGPTREHIDPVRFLSNPSTGKMGFAVARAAAARGHDVTLISGPVALKTPKGVRRIDVTSAREMLKAVLETIGTRLSDAECRTSRKQSPCRGLPVVLVSTAAVADWRPAKCAPRKLKKSQMSDVLKLVRNPDILKTVSRRFAQPPNPPQSALHVSTCSTRLIRPPQSALHVSTCSTRLINPARTPILVGFAAETGDPVAEAVRKCREKGLAMVVANDVTAKGAGFGTDTNRVAFIRRDGSAERLPVMTKLAVARRIVRECEGLCP